MWGGSKSVLAYSQGPGPLGRGRGPAGPGAGPTAAGAAAYFEPYVLHMSGYS